jgi:hypothetical protein
MASRFSGSTEVGPFNFLRKEHVSFELAMKFLRTFHEFVEVF